MESIIIKNSSYLLVAQLLVKALAFLYNIFLAGSLSVSDFGFYTTAIAYFSILGGFTDFGISRYLTKEISCGREGRSLLCRVVLLRLSVTAITFASFAVLLSIVDPERMRVSLALIAVSAIIPQSIALSLDSWFIAKGRFLFSAIGLVVLNLTTLIFGVWWVSSTSNPLGAVSALVAGQIGYVLFLALLPYGWSGRIVRSIVASKVGLSFGSFKEIVYGSAPYGMLGILGLLYFKIDILMLSYLRGPIDTAVYGIAYKFLEAVIFIPSAVSAVMFPMLARLHMRDFAEVEKVYYKSLKVMFAVACFITVLYLVVLPAILTIVLPQYGGAVTAIQVLSLAILPMFVHTPAAVVLLSTDKFLKEVSALSVAALCLNIGLNAYFIPHYGFIGAAIVTVFSECFSLAAFYALLKIKVFRKVV